MLRDEDDHGPDGLRARVGLRATDAWALLVCVTCELTIRTTPYRLGEATFCCDGCGAGGPCCCTYDEISA